MPTWFFWTMISKSKKPLLMAFANIANNSHSKKNNTAMNGGVIFYLSKEILKYSQ